MGAFHTELKAEEQLKDFVLKRTTKKTVIILYSLLALFFIFSLWIMFFPAGRNYDELVRSSSLEAKTVEEGNVVTVTYLNEKGEPTIADNLKYATVKRTFSGNTMVEEYYDAEGNRLKMSSGHYALRKEYNDSKQILKNTYLDENGQPINNKSGYSYWVRTYNADGQLATERYFDVDGNPVSLENSGYGCDYTYEDGFSIIRYVDGSGNPVMIKAGYAMIKRRLYEDGVNAGKVADEFYFDESGKPVTLTHGEYGTHREYDEFGRSGRPMLMQQEGYSTLRKTFYGDDSTKTEKYFDLEGNPVAISQGQYGILREGDKITYLDAEGNKMFDLKLFLHNQPFSVIAAALFFVILSLLTGQKINLGLLVIYFGVIAYMTLMERTQSLSSMHMEMFWSFRKFFEDPSIRRDIINNIWLFIPLGTIIYRLCPKLIFILFPFLVSTGVELAQYILRLGYFEVDDIVCNAIGGAIGFMVGFTFYRNREDKQTAKAETD